MLTKHQLEKLDFVVLADRKCLKLGMADVLFMVNWQFSKSRCVYACSLICCALWWCNQWCVNSVSDPFNVAFVCQIRLFFFAFNLFISCVNVLVLVMHCSILVRYTAGKGSTHRDCLNTRRDVVPQMFQAKKVKEGERNRLYSWGGFSSQVQQACIFKKKKMGSVFCYVVCTDRHTERDGLMKWGQSATWNISDRRMEDRVYVTEEERRGHGVKNRCGYSMWTGSELQVTAKTGRAYKKTVSHS